MAIKGTAVGNTNIIIYVKETLTESDKQQIEGSKLIDVIKQLGIPVGRPVAIDDQAVAIYETDNFVMASLKVTLAKWCKVESFTEVHPRLTPNLGNLAKGSN
jgi:hypothetical protein